MDKNRFNRLKAEQLGMPFGTANGRLRKMILFDMLERHDENVCFRCNQLIEDYKELSIEHKEPWFKKDTKLFWDLKNIAFSHLSCNIGAGERHKIIPISGKLKCNCCGEWKNIEEFNRNNRRSCGRYEKCRKCQSEYESEYRAKNK